MYFLNLGQLQRRLEKSCLIACVSRSDDIRKNERKLFSGVFHSGEGQKHLSGFSEEKRPFVILIAEE